MKIGNHSTPRTSGVSGNELPGHEPTQTVKPKGTPMAIQSPAEALNRLKASSEAAAKGGKLGNFEIQDLMAQYNQAETVASNGPNENGATKGIIGKVMPNDEGATKGIIGKVMPNDEGATKGIIGKV